MSKQIQIRIFPDGQVKADVVGFQGKACTEYISVLEALLDAEVVDSERTPEYYLTEEVSMETESDVLQVQQDVNKLDAGR